MLDTVKINHVQHISFTQSRLTDAVSVILSELLSYEHPANAQEFCLWATKKIFSAVLRMTSNSRKNLYSVNHICDFYFIIRE